MAIEIVSFPIKKGDFPVRYVTNYQRINPIKSPWYPIKSPLNPTKSPLNPPKNIHNIPPKKSLELQILQNILQPWGASVLLLQQEIPENINLAAAEVDFFFLRFGDFVQNLGIVWKTCWDSRGNLGFFCIKDIKDVRSKWLYTNK